MRRLIGTSVPRLEDRALLTGKARFIDDIAMPGMLHAAFVRSPHAHALVTRLDKGAAEALPGVKAVFFAPDLRSVLTSDRLLVALPSASYRQDLNRPVLASDEVVHVGEPVAIVLAEDRYVAEDAAALVEVDYEPLPAIADCKEALVPGSALVHRASPDNLLADFVMSYGEVDEAFAAAPHVIRENLWMHRGGSHSLECRGTVAIHEELDDCLVVWSSTQMPHVTKRHLCDLFGREQDRVRVVAPDIGGAFGPKLVFYPEDAAVAASAMLLKLPCKWIEDRREHFVATTQERDQYWDVEIAFDERARILGVRGMLVHDHGAYTARGLNLPYESAQVMTLAYDVPAYHLDVKVALTNKVPATPVRGAGQPQGVFAMERLLDRVARHLQLDRAEVRRRNLIPAERMPCPKPLYTRSGVQVVLDSGNYPACLERAMAESGWRDFPERQARARAEGRFIGIGVANFVKGTGRGPYESVTVRVAPTGRVGVYSGATAMGQSTKTMLAQIVADGIGTDIASVDVTAGDTSATALGFGGFNSRQAVIAGSSALLAAQAVRAKIFAAASYLLDVGTQALEFNGGSVMIRGTDRKIGLGEVARALMGTAGLKLPGDLGPGLEATEQCVIDSMTYANGTTVAEVEVDIDTCAVTVRRLVVVHDCGRMINPMIVDGQILGGIAHGVGNTLFEWMKYDGNAQPVTTNYGEYLLLSATEMPPAEIHHEESPTPLNPLGVKGVGECGVLPTPAAIVSAIEDALSPLGVDIRGAPLTPADLHALAASAAAKRGAR